MKKRFAISAIALCMAIGLCGCGTAVLDRIIGELKGELVGNDYQVFEYDNFGNQVLQVSGNKIAMSAEVDSAGEPTSYIDITVDGYDWMHVGSTLVFAQNGVDMITDFQIPETIETNRDGSLGLIAADRFVNSYKNLFGKSQVVLVSSQTGTPIGLFQGDKCNVSIPSNLPKTTLVSIDGKLVYVHRANVDIMPTAMFKD
jgi:hypothetical protein